MTLGVTGHRPEKLFPDQPYSDANRKKLVKFATRVLKVLKPDKVITGMALGWDQAIAEACIDLSIPFVAAIPCHEYDKLWWPASQAHFRALMIRASETVFVTKGPYTTSCLQARNLWIVENSDQLLALFSGAPGGTANCINAWPKARDPVLNVWNSWLNFEMVN